MRTIPTPTPAALGALLAALVLLTGCGDPQPPLRVSPAGHDFGAVMQGETRRKAFTITNHGDRTVAFTARANCGCLGVAQTLSPLDPGTSLEFTVIFTSINLPPQKMRGKYVTVTTDHPEQPEIVIGLEGEVFRAYDLRPARFLLGHIDGRPSNYETHEVVIRPEAGQTVRYLGSFSMPPGVYDVAAKEDGQGGLRVALDLRKDAARPQGQLEVHVRLDLEITGPDGTTRRDQPMVQLQGSWLLPSK